MYIVESSTNLFPGCWIVCSQKIQLGRKVGRHSSAQSQGCWRDCWITVVSFRVMRTGTNACPAPSTCWYILMWPWYALWPVIVSEQNTAVRPVLLDVLLSHQCLETGVQLIDTVVAAYCCLSVITHSIQEVLQWSPDVMNLWRNVFSYDSIRVFDKWGLCKITSWKFLSYLGLLYCDKIISLHTSIRS